MLTPVLAAVRKDLLLFAGDRRALIMALAAPIAIASFFGAIFSGTATEAPSRVPILVSDQDRTRVSAAIVSALQMDEAVTVRLDAPDVIRESVRRGDAAVGVIIPAGFSAAATSALFGTNPPPELELAFDPSRAAELGMVRGMLTGHVMQAVSGDAFGGAGGEQLAQDTLAQLDGVNMDDAQRERLRTLLTALREFSAANAAQPGGNGGGIVVPFVTREQAMTAQAGMPYNSYAHSFAGMTVQFVLFAAIDLGILILLERQQGLWKRLRSAPVSKAQLLGGRLVSGAIIGLGSMLASFAFAMLVFDVRIAGSVVGFFAVAISFVVMAASFGLLLAAIGGTPNATRGVAILATLLMVMLGGAWVPTFVFPEWLQQLTVVMPTRWAVDGLDAMTWRGVGAAGAVLPSAVLLGFAALFASLALVRFRWEEA